MLEAKEVAIPLMDVPLTQKQSQVKMCSKHVTLSWWLLLLGEGCILIHIQAYAYFHVPHILILVK